MSEHDRSESSATDDYFEFMSGFAASDAWKAQARFRQLLMSINVFTGNTSVLLTTLAALPTREMFETIGPDENVAEREKAMTEVMRLTFNFLSAARSLNHHLDKFRVYYDKNRRREFNRELNRRWRGRPITTVVQEMRNLFVHDEIPPPTVTFHVDVSGGLDISINLDIDTVLGLRKWSERDRAFLATLRYPAGLAHLVKPYSDAAIDFLTWFLPWHESVAGRWVADELERMTSESERLREAMTQSLRCSQ